MPYPPKPHQFELVPHVGIGPLRLGMTLPEADAAVGKFAGGKERTSRRSVHYYFEAALQIELGESETIQFIGVSHHSRLQCTYRDQDIFDIAAPDLFALIASHERGEHQYRAGSYLFPIQVVTLWDADEQYDRKRNESRPVWGQIGVGNAEYLKAIAPLSDER